jgi:hypothetical protein
MQVLHPYGQIINALPLPILCISPDYIRHQRNRSIDKLPFRRFTFRMAPLLILSVLLGLVFSIDAYAYNTDHTNPDSDYQHHWFLRNTVPSYAGINSDDVDDGNSRDDLATIVSDLVQRLGTLQATVQQQATAILNLESKLDQATQYQSLYHRSLQTNDDCLPELIETSDGELYCDFKHVVRFDNDAIFNQDAFFNQNVEYVSVLRRWFILSTLGLVLRELKPSMRFFSFCYPTPSFFCVDLVKILTVCRLLSLTSTVSRRAP